MIYVDFFNAGGKRRKALLLYELQKYCYKRIHLNFNLFVTKIYKDIMNGS